MKIQYKSRPLCVEFDERDLFYRIDPSELSWWKRTFKNPWRNVYRSCNFVLDSNTCTKDCLRFLFSAEEANELASKYDTYEKITDFLTAEYNKAVNMYREVQEKYRKKNSCWKF